MIEVNISVAKVVGWIGLGILGIIAVYLVLMIVGIVHSAIIELLLLGVVIGQIFYNGYTYRAIQEMDRKIEWITKKLEKK